MATDLNDEETNVDEVLRKFGNFGRYQMYQVLQIYMGFIPDAFNILAIIILIYDIPMQCQPLENLNLTNASLPTNSQIIYKQCHIEVHDNGSMVSELPCDNGYFYPTGKHMSLKSEWNLVCDKENLADLIMSTVQIGKLVGCFILPSFADKYGRKPIYIISLALLTVINIVNTFSPSYEFYLGSKILSGFMQAGMMVTGATMLTELFPTEKRTLVMLIGGVAWSIGVMLLSLMGYILEPYGWRYLNMTSGFVSIYTFFQIWTYNESLRWLLAKGKWDRADALIRKICRTNKVEYHTIEPLLKYRHTLRKNYKENTEDEGQTMIPLKEIVQTEPNKPIQKTRRKIPRVLYILLTPILRKYMLLSMYFWFVSALVYYGLYVTVSQLSGNMFLNIFLNSLMELAANASAIKVVGRLGRTKSLSLFQTVTGLSLITAVILKYFSENNYGLQIGTTVFSLIGMFSISAAFCIIWLYTPELFPTGVRNVGMATSNTASLIGNMLAPFSNTLANYASWAPGVIFGCLSLLCNVFVIFLPETSHRQLPQTTEDVEAWGKEKREKKLNKTKKAKNK